MLSNLFAALPFVALTLATPIARQQPEDAIRIVSNRSGRCVAVIPGAPSDSNIGLVDCENATRWTAKKDQRTFISVWTPDGEHGSGSGRQPIDAGHNPTNNGKLFLQQMGDIESTGLNWYLTTDNRIAHFEGTQCWDEGDDGLQTYQCTTGNTNQIFTTVAAPPQ